MLILVNRTTGNVFFESVWKWDEIPKRESLMSLFTALEWLPRMCIWIRKESWLLDTVTNSFFSIRNDNKNSYQMLARALLQCHLNLNTRSIGDDLTWHDLWTSLLCCILCQNHRVHNEFWISDLYLNVPNCNVLVKMQAKMLQTLNTRDISMPCFRPHPFDNGGLNPSKI